MDSPKAPPKAPIGPALRALAARARRELDHHPDTDELVAYHEQRLDEEKTERLRDHLTLCADCAGLLLDLSSFSASAQAPREPSLPPVGQVEEAWREIAPRLGTLVPQANLPQRSRSKVALAWVVAATLLLGVVGLTAWVALLRSDLRSFAQPRADVVLVDLEPIGEGTRGETGLSKERPHANRPATLIFHLSPARTYPAYQLQVVQDQLARSVIWQGGNLRPRALGTFVLDLPPGALPPGKYWVRLYGVERDRREPLAEYSLTVAGD
jgi:hypothetical protein